MRLSVIVAAYNCEDTIERALRSVLDQTTPVAEVVVVDDASTDGTVALVRKMAHTDPRIVLIEGGQNRGPSGARNLGLEAATGDWVAVLDADDAWSLDRVQVFADVVARVDLDIVADNQFLYDAGADKVTRLGFSPDHGPRWIGAADVFEQDVQLGAEFSYGILKPAIRRAFLQAHRLGYSNSIRYGEDLLFLAEMLICGARALLIPTPHYIYTTRVGDESKTASPHSRSIPRFDLFATGIEALKSEYAASIGKDVEAAMGRLAARFRRVHEANLARQVRHQQGLSAYALYLLRRPPALAQVARQRAGYARGAAAAKLHAAWRRIGVFPAGGEAARPGASAWSRRAGRELVTALAFAAPLVVLTTLVRWLLASGLQSQSPFMIYVAAVVPATLVVGPLCGALVIAGGALAGLHFFVQPADSLGAQSANLMAMAMFCLVSLSVLFPISALRRRLGEPRQSGLRSALHTWTTSAPSLAGQWTAAGAMLQLDPVRRVQP